MTNTNLTEYKGTVVLFVINYTSASAPYRGESTPYVEST